MKKFTCSCIDEQFKKPDKVYVDFNDEYLVAVPCVYRPNDKVTLRQAKLEIEFCPKCGRKLENI